MRAAFDRFARLTTYYAGRPLTFVVYVAVVVAWLALGPGMGWSELWHLLINSPTTVVTCGLGLLILAAQARDTAEVKAMLRQLTEDISEVDEVKAGERAVEEEKP